MGWLDKVAKEVKRGAKKVERELTRVGVQAESAVGLDPEYKREGVFEVGVEVFDVEEWMTPSGLFGKDRHCVYTNRYTKTKFQGDAGSTYHEVKQHVEKEIRDSYRYTASDATRVNGHDSLPVEMGSPNFISLLITLATNAGVLHNGAAFVLERQVDLSSFLVKARNGSVILPAEEGLQADLATLRDLFVGDPSRFGTSACLIKDGQWRGCKVVLLERRRRCQN
uniref:Uncharacterized protein n=1 Tax=Chromera velia CCMP2878 TaxID=1169474 RepID=A0A0G4HC72_9ALVE|eukprot:Cvel_26132.t1-p1 / transcript=Cvel_26132.t1 / gene=Cvel_26132 / organism=Chromera_velia_CCMP2878 / gene_product=hypothetical protein / transcript_product=hypothetical protein / location=Cvel_scaffold3060:7140-7808(+) / protein_length=223 / sequence_SO=supercontig / SO=protein_coding / is_pseudo=false